MRHLLVLTAILASALSAAGAHAQSMAPPPPPQGAPPPAPPPGAAPMPYGAPPQMAQPMPYGAPPGAAQPSYPAPPPYAGAPPYPPPPGQATAPNCREFTATVMIAGQPQPASGQACQRPDGSWQVTESAPGQPPQAYVLPPNAIYANPYPDPFYWSGVAVAGLPLFIGGSVIFADAFHHFHPGPGHHHYGPGPHHYHDGFRGDRR